MTRQVEISTGSRLHFGLLSHAPATGPEFGGAGLMIASPGFHLVAEQYERDLVEAGEPYGERIARFAARFRQRATELELPACRLRLDRVVPPHCGFGSGTQLGMAVSRALSLLAGDDERNPAELARRVGRGARSAIGIHGFAAGGFLVDAGKAVVMPTSGPPDERAGRLHHNDGGDIAPLAARVDFPSAWRLLLITPPDEAGLSGTLEENAFARLSGMPAETTATLRSIAHQRLLPAIARADLEETGEALYEFGRLVGEYFAPIQGGIYAHPLMRRLADDLRKRGIRGVGQTSWGPTLFALVEGETSAARLSADLAAHNLWKSCRFHVAAALNTGAAVTVRDNGGSQSA